MGYRYRLGRIPKKMKREVEGLSQDQVCEKYEIDCVEFELPGYKQLYELGKYCEYTTKFKPFFSFELDDSEFHIVKPDFLQNIIEDYRTKALENAKNHHAICQEMKETKVIDEEKLDKIHLYFCNLVFDFSRSEYFHLDVNKEMSITWDYSRAIYNLLELYRNFNWRRDYLIYSAW